MPRVSVPSGGLSRAAALRLSRYLHEPGLWGPGCRGIVFGLCWTSISVRGSPTSSAAFVRGLSGHPMASPAASVASAGPRPSSA